MYFMFNIMLHFCTLHQKYTLVTLANIHKLAIVEWCHLCSFPNSSYLIRQRTMFLSHVSSRIQMAHSRILIKRCYEI